MRKAFVFGAIVCALTASAQEKSLNSIHWKEQVIENRKPEPARLGGYGNYGSQYCRLL